MLELLGVDESESAAVKPAAAAAAGGKAHGGKDGDNHERSTSDKRSHVGLPT